MFPAWLRLTLYIAAAFAGVWLLFRWWQSRRSAAPRPRRQLPTGAGGGSPP